MNNSTRSESSAVLLGRGGDTTREPLSLSAELAPPAIPSTQDLRRMLAGVKGQAHFLLYLADQLEDALQQAEAPTDSGHLAFLGKVLGMYSSQLESKHHGLGDRITEVCQELYLLVREIDAS